MAVNKDTTELVIGGVAVPFVYRLLRHAIVDVSLPFIRTALVGTLYYIAQRQGADTVKDWLDNYREHHKKHPPQV